MDTKIYFNPPIQFDGFKLIELRKSDRKQKKYMAQIVTKDESRFIYFGARDMPQYRDSSPLKLYSDLDHLNLQRKKKFQSRFKNKNGPASQLSKYFLWS